MEGETLKFAIDTERMKQTYEVWDVLLGRAVDLTVKSIIDDWEGFRILIRDHQSGGMIRISFARHIAC
jgi:hypothetical protein